MKRIPLTVTWIHVSEALPHDGDVVMASFTARDGTRHRDTARYMMGAFYDYIGLCSEVDFWMPIPVLPEDVVLEECWVWPWA